MVKLIKKSIFVGLLGMCGIFAGGIINIANAKIMHFRVGESRDFGIKVAMLPIENQAKYNYATDTTAIINDDLNYSGQIKIVELNWQDPELTQQIPLDLENIDFKFWKNIGLEYLVITKIYPSKDAKQLIINLQVLDLYKPLAPIILDQEIPKEPNEHPRKLAHKLAGVIFEQLTGISSFFNKQIAYIRAENLGTNTPEYSLNKADFDGFNEKTILKTNYPLMSPSWSKDVDKIAFVSFRGNRANVSVLNMRSQEVKVVAKYPGINGAPAWSPSGDKLALVLSKDGSPSIYILNISSNTLERITFGASIDTEPCWSKSGEEIFFTSNRGGKPQIYKVHLATKKVTRVTFKGDYNSSPSLTPDNRYMVMLHCNKNCSKKEARFVVAVQALETGKIKVLTNSGTEESPRVAPNGILVMYSTNSQANGNKILAGVAIEGHCNNYLSIMGKGSVKDPVWSP